MLIEKIKKDFVFQKITIKFVVGLRTGLNLLKLSKQSCFWFFCCLSFCLSVFSMYRYVVCLSVSLSFLSVSLSIQLIFYVVCLSVSLSIQLIFFVVRLSVSLSMQLIFFVVSLSVSLYLQCFCFLLFVFLFLWLFFLSLCLFNWYFLLSFFTNLLISKTLKWNGIGKIYLNFILFSRIQLWQEIRKKRK
jgi:hypothetical protein